MRSALAGGRHCFSHSWRALSCTHTRTRKRISPSANRICGAEENTPDKARVRLNTGPLALDEVESGVVRHVVCVDEVGNDDRRRP